ncbi:MAG TPA: alpha/beta hydrolase [Micropepsaceae bacterium]|nr:alpha/beta hydrolase [Micropepsaceae bacterium]
MPNCLSAIHRRRFMSGIVGGAAAAGFANSVRAQTADAVACRIGPPAHAKGPPVWMDMDQIELDAAYDQAFYAPMGPQIAKRIASASDAVRARLGEPLRAAYGPADIERLDVFRARKPNAPIFVFIHGGEWKNGTAREHAYPAEMFVNAGANFVVLDFIHVTDAGGDLGVMASQVRKAIAWTYRNATSFGADPNRLYIGGRSSGAHLTAVALVTDWAKDFGVPANIVKGGICSSGMYDMKPVRLSKRSGWVKFTDEMEDAMSPQRHLDMLRAPVTVLHGTNETPEFQRQARDFAAAAKAAGKDVRLISAPDYNHPEMGESFGNPYGPSGRASLALMNLPILA